MSKLSWITKQPTRIRRQGIRETIDQDQQEIVNHLLPQASRFDHIGEPIFEKEWDVLVILDACRVDLLESASNKYHFYLLQSQLFAL